jgi:hypothetical protein
MESQPIDLVVKHAPHWKTVARDLVTREWNPLSDYLEPERCLIGIIRQINAQLS